MVPGDGQPAPTEVRQVAIVLGGDGTMLRALQGFLGTGVPVVGVNFGRVGFLSSIGRDDLEVACGASSEESWRWSSFRPSTSRPTANASSPSTTRSSRAATLGRMVEIEWSIGGQDFGLVPCDGLICSTPSGSTAYNLSNGGPVLMWGLDAMALTFVAPHDLRARPFVVPRGHALEVWNRTADVGCAVLVDGHHLADAGPGEQVIDQARRAALAPRHAAGRDLRAPLPPELRPRVAAPHTVFRTWRRRHVCDTCPGLPSARCCADSGSRISSSSARRSWSSRPG